LLTAPFLNAGTPIELCTSPIFVIGSFRSGTTALAKSLGEHSELWYGKHESNFVTGIFSRMDFDQLAASGETWLEKNQLTKGALAASLGLGVNALFSSRSGGKRWIEKTPRNALIGPTLAAAFPDSVFIHTLRDGRYVVNSMLHFMDAIADHTKANWTARGYTPEWTKGFRKACGFWPKFVKAAMELEADQPDRCLTVRYEALVEDPEQVFRRIFQFLRVPYERAAVECFRSTRFNSSFPTKWREGLDNPWTSWTRDERATFLEIAGQTMLRTGYLSEEELRALHDEVDAIAS
jgi:hypothetical protein